jgi:hypothetical protein
MARAASSSDRESEETERLAALDDREDLHAPGGPQEVRRGGMAGLVGGDGPPLLVRVHDGLLQPDLLGQLGLVHVRDRHRVPSASQRGQERLVEEVLDHHRGVAQRVVGQPLPRVLVI